MSKQTNCNSNIPIGTLLMCTATPDLSSATPIGFITTTTEAGRLPFPWPDCVPTGGANLTIISPGYRQFDGRIFIPVAGQTENVAADGTVLPPIVLVPGSNPFRKPVASLPRLQRRDHWGTAGAVFSLPDGDRFTWIGASQFNLLNRFLNGEDLDPLLTQLCELGFNGVRVFTAYALGDGSPGTIGTLIPRDRPDLYGQIPIFCQTLASYGLYPEFVAGTGPYDVTFGNDEQQMIAHYVKLGTVLEHDVPWALLEDVNEYDHPANDRWPVGRLPRFGVWTSHGSRMNDGPPVEPIRDYVTMHPGPGLSGEWQRRVGHETYNNTASLNTIVISDEFARYPDHESSVEHFADAMEDAAMEIGGSTFHSVYGKCSLPWPAPEYEAIRQIIGRVRGFPLDFQDGAYVHRTDLETPDLTRVYGHRFSDGREYDVRINK